MAYARSAIFVVEAALRDDNDFMQNVVISITEACPNRCRSCFVPKSPLQMTFKNFKKIIDRLPKDIENIVISGGEPSTHRALLSMVKYCSREFGVRPSIFTSGILPKELSLRREIDSLKNHVYDMTVTLKYPSSKGDDRWKGNSGAFAKATKFLGVCRKAGVPTNINFCVDRINIGRYEGMLSTAEKFNSILCVIRFVPYRSKDRKIALSDTGWDSFCERIHRNKSVRILYPSRCTYMDCIAGIHRMSILPNGKVSPCIYWSFSTVGNILEEDYNIIEKRLEKWRMGIGDSKGCPVLRRAEK